MDFHPGSGMPRAVFWLKYERYPYLLAKLAFFGAIAWAVYSILHVVQPVLLPVLVSLLIAYLLDPAVDRFEARGYSRVVGILWCLVLGFGGLAAFALLLWPTAAHLVDAIASGVPQVFDLLTTQAIPWVEETVLPWIERTTGVDMPDSLQRLVPELGSTMQGQVPGLLRRLYEAVSTVWTSTGAIVASVLNLVLIPVLSFYFLRDFDIMRLSAAEYLPQHNRDWWIERFTAMDVVVGAWFRGQIEVAFILAGLYAFGLATVFGVSDIGALDGVAIGILAGLLNIVPYFGFAVGFGLAVLLALLDWSGWGALLGVVVVFAVVQGLEGYVITPRVVGEKVGLSPVVVIVTLLLGGTLLGLLGILIALPLAGALRVLLPDLIAWYRRSDVYTGKAEGVSPPTLPPPPAMPPG